VAYSSIGLFIRPGNRYFTYLVTGEKHAPNHLNIIVDGEECSFRHKRNIHGMPIYAEVIWLEKLCDKED
jgi:hypothetical protein